MGSEMCIRDRATANNGAQVVLYSGTATATTLYLNSQYVDASGISHNETYDLSLSSPTALGSMNEELSVLGLPFVLDWNIEATKN